MPRTPDELRGFVEDYLGELALQPELGSLEEPIRHALSGGGKRVRPVLCLATGEAVGAEPRHVLPAAAAVELVHSFSLVHDDLPALDNDTERRDRDPRRRRVARRGVPARARLRGDGDRARADGGDARDDRRPAARPRGWP